MEFHGPWRAPVAAKELNEHTNAILLVPEQISDGMEEKRTCFVVPHGYEMILTV
jgi:hypothetical protein